MPSPLPQPPPGFDRELTEENLITSTCKACGFTMLGNVTNGHIAREQKHRELCQHEPSVTDGVQEQPLPAEVVMPLSLLSAGRDPILVKTRNQVLASLGCSVTPALTSAELVNRFFDGDYDLLVLCHTIPPEERRKVLRMVKVYRPSMHVVVVGDLLDDSFADVPLHLEVRNVAHTPEALVEAVRSVFPERTDSA